MCSGKKFLVNGFVFGAALAMALGAWAQGGEGGPRGRQGEGRGGMGMRQPFKSMDKNQDGAVTRQEFTEASKTQLQARFKHMDRDSNGSLSEEEAQPPRPPGNERQEDGNAEQRPEPPRRPEGATRPPTFATMDANSDAKVTVEEFVAAWQTFNSAHFTRMDADGNGSLTQEEFKSRPGGRPGGRGAGRGPRE